MSVPRLPDRSRLSSFSHRPFTPPPVAAPHHVALRPVPVPPPARAVRPSRTLRGDIARARASVTFSAVIEWAGLVAFAAGSVWALWFVSWVLWAL